MRSSAPPRSATPSMDHAKALLRRHAARPVPIEHDRPSASAAARQRGDFSDQPLRGLGAVAPPAVRTRPHHVVAVDEHRELHCLGHAVLPSPSCREGRPPPQRCPLPGPDAMIPRARVRDAGRTPSGAVSRPAQCSELDSAPASGTNGHSCNCTVLFLLLGALGLAAPTRKKIKTRRRCLSMKVRKNTHRRR